mgnify:CR=1 FL=1
MSQRERWRVIRSGFGTRRPQQVHFQLLGTALLVTAAACADAPLPAPGRTETISLSEAVTPKVAAGLSLEGRFDVAVSANEPGIEITPARAAELALAFAQQYAPYSRSLFEKAAGRRLDFQKLLADGRVFYAQSPYDELDARYSKPMQKAAGGYYIVNLLQDGQPALSVAVSAKASDVEIRGGRLLFPRHNGNEFLALGVRRGNREFPIAPELAAVRAAEQSGAKVAAAPTLIMPAFGTFAPHYARWRIPLDRPVATISGESVSVVYSEWDGRIVVPSVTDAVEDKADLTLKQGLTSGASLREAATLPSRRSTARHFVQFVRGLNGSGS